MLHSEETWRALGSTAPPVTAVGARVESVMSGQGMPEHPESLSSDCCQQQKGTSTSAHPARSKDSTSSPPFLLAVPTFLSLPFRWHPHFIKKRHSVPPSALLDYLLQTPVWAGWVALTFGCRQRGGGFCRGAAVSPLSTDETFPHC